MHSNVLNKLTHVSLIESLVGIEREVDCFEPVDGDDGERPDLGEGGSGAEEAVREAA